MRKFLTFILTFWLLILMIGFGFIVSAKSILVSTADIVIKKEIKDSFVSTTEKYIDDKIPTEIVQKIEEKIENDETIKTIIDNNYDTIIAMLGSKETNAKINVAEELNKLIESSEQILEENNIKITDEMKDEILAIASSDEVNNLVNDAISDIKNDLDSNVVVIIDTYSFITSTTFKAIMIGLMVLTLLLIALLKKSVYSWLSNLGTASILTGVLMAFAVPFLIDQVMLMLEPEEKINISISSIVTYGYVTLAIGIISIIINIVISKLNKEKIAEE